jgi:hypothetical protein
MRLGVLHTRIACTGKFVPTVRALTSKALDLSGIDRVWKFTLLLIPA